MSNAYENAHVVNSKISHSYKIEISVRGIAKTFIIPSETVNIDAETLAKSFSEQYGALTCYRLIFGNCASPWSEEYNTAG